MTLDDIAASTGLTPNYIGSIELGHRDPSLSTILALSKGLGVRPGELFPSSAGLDAMTDEAARLFDQMPPDVQASIMAVLKSALKKPR